MNNLAVQKRLESLAPEDIARTYKRIFESDDGRLILQDLTNRFNPPVPAVPEDMPVDPYRLAINEGKRSVVFHIEGQLLPEEPNVAAGSD